jgi:type IV secretory pathway TraG/TraD family ATPase VirD4
LACVAPCVSLAAEAPSSDSRRPPIRLGGPAYAKTPDPDALALAHRALGYRAAYCPNVPLQDADRIRAMARHFGREQDVILLRVEEAADIKPRHRFNLTGNHDIPFLTYARMVVDTGVAMGQRQDQSFFRTQARDHIAAALEALQLIQCEVTLENAYHLLLDVGELTRVVGELRKLTVPAPQRLAHHFEEHYLKQPAEQLGGVQGSIANYLSGFLADPVAEVFFRDSTFSFDDLDRGKIICLAVPQKFAVQRRYLSTFLKQLFYFHALSRYDCCAADRAAHNLLVLWADEAQHFVTDSEEGLSDYNAIDRIREAKATVVMATQSIQSFVPPLHRDKAEVLRLNLRNRLIFQAATEADAQDAADFLGKRLRQKVTRSFGQRGAQRSYVEEEVHRLKPHQFRLLRPHECVCRCPEAACAARPGPVPAPPFPSACAPRR